MGLEGMALKGRKKGCYEGALGRVCFQDGVRAESWIFDGS